MEKIEQKTIDAIRVLCADTVQKANSGHPGLPLGAAPAAFGLWAKEMRHNPLNPDWQNRDRFVLSAGHGSSLLYALLHLFGYGLTADDLKRFRQLGSLTPGHPEYKHTAGIEVTTGPLGQGIANAIGMAWAESYLASVFNKPGYSIVDHYTFALCGDGCLMEGVSSEAASLAGTLGLSKMILLYDSNKITIEGSTDIAFRENVLKRFEAYNWHVQSVEDGNDMSAVVNAIKIAKNETKRPSIIEIKTEIGFGAPNKQGKASAHGEPLGDDEIKLMKEAFGWTEEPFEVPAAVWDYIKTINAQNADSEAEWNKLMDGYRSDYPTEYEEWQKWHDNKLPVDLLENEDFWKYEGDIATRVSSEKVLNKVSKLVPNLIGGSADLAPSNKSIMKDREDYTPENHSGSNLHFGVREHAMTAIANGLALHGGLRPYIAGFFVFSDYMKPAMRLSALMKLPVISIMTHDSIGVGEDGPTHQPIEHLAALRATPNYTVFRPCDTNETAAAWYLALTRTDSPSTLALSRQNLKLLETTGKNSLRGGYVLKDCENPQIILLASGSEVELVLKASEVLMEKGVTSRVVSMLSFEVFDEQDDEYKESVLPKNIRARLAVEAAAPFGWHKYIGLDGDIIAVDTFGDSAPYAKLFEKYGFTVENVVEKALAVLKNLS